MVEINFHKNAAAIRPTEDVTRFVEVDIFEIESSELNPRQTRGVHYESIKASINNIGLQNPLVITRKPGSSHYSLYYGGNTRLAILKELVDECMALGDKDKAERLRFQHCRFVPYTSDLDVLVKHMAENEERSGMTLIDKARAVFRIREMYLQTHGVEKISNNKLVQYIHSMGWTRINQPVMTELAFAYEHLQAVIPLALAAGLGKRKIFQLRQWIKHVEIFVAWLEAQGKLHRTVTTSGGQQVVTYGVAEARALYFQVLTAFDTDIQLPDAEMPEGMTALDPPVTADSDADEREEENNRLIDLTVFFEEYRYRLSDALRPFDPDLTSVRIDYEIEQIRLHGYVPEVRPREELRRELRETATTPPAVFPEPRKPRTVRDKGTSESDEYNDTAAGGIIGLTESNNVPPAGAFSDPPASTGRHEDTPQPLSPQIQDIRRELGGNAAKPMATIPFGPSFPLPDDKLPWTQYNAAVRIDCTRQIRLLLQECDSSGALAAMVHDHDEENIPCEEAPYVNMLLHEPEHYHRMEKVIGGDKEHEAYAALYCLHVWDFYLAYIFTSGGLTEAQQRTADNVRQLWQQYAHRFVDYQSQCRTGIVHLRYEKSRALDMLLADRAIQQHAILLSAIEMHSSVGDAEDT